MKKLTNEEFLQRLKDKKIFPIFHWKNIKLRQRKLNGDVIKSKSYFRSYTKSYSRRKRMPILLWEKSFLLEKRIYGQLTQMLRKMLENPNEGYMYTAFSNHRTNWKCPNCGHLINNRKIADMTIYGLYCPVCSDGVSYPEKFVANMLKQLEINFIYDRPRKWSKNKRYDFYIEQYNMIIECHGL